MNDIREIRDRLETVERKVAELQEDSATTRAIAAMADRDVASFRQEMAGHRGVLNALRETQLEHGAALDELRGDVTSMATGQQAIMQHLGIADRRDD